MARPAFSDSGAFLVGTFLGGILFGVLCVQIYMYHLAFPKDRPTIKTLVYAIFAIETAETIIYMATSYHLIGTTGNRGDNAVFNQRQATWFLPVLASIVITAVQCYYANCVRLISRTWVTSGAIIVVSFVQLGAGIAKAQNWYQYGDGVLGNVAKIEDSIWHGASLFCDLAIAGCMTYFLRKNFSDLSLTKRPVERIIRLTIETGVLITAVTIVCTGLLAGLDPAYHTNFQRVFIAIIGKLYANSLLVLINSRINLQQEIIRHNIDYAPTPAYNTYGSPPSTPARDVMLSDFQRSQMTSGQTETAYGTSMDVTSIKGSQLVKEPFV